MKILLTNDDGFDAPGIKELVRILSPLHEVWVVAPDRQRSGVSHAITLREPGRFQKITERQYTCSGTPVDCVVLSKLGALPCSPDVVISGINQGPNLGTDIIFSGTCGAARQAALGGIPGIAISCASYTAPYIYTAASSFLAENLEALAGACTRETFLNINVPSSEDIHLQALWVRPGRNRYLDSLNSFSAPDGSIYHFLGEGRHEIIEENDTDHSTLVSGKIAVSPVLVYPQIPAGFVPGLYH